MNEYLEKISIDEAIEVAKKYAEDISMFASVDKYAVSKVCQMLLQQLQAYKDKEDKLRLGIKFIEDNLYVLIDKSKINNKTSLNLETNNYYKLLDNIKILKELLNEGDEPNEDN